MNAFSRNSVCNPRNDRFVTNSPILVFATEYLWWNRAKTYFIMLIVPKNEPDIFSSDVASLQNQRKLSYELGMYANTHQLNAIQFSTLG